jgi:osmotically inducible protein OsmC
VEDLLQQQDKTLIFIQQRNAVCVLTNRGELCYLEYCKWFHRFFGLRKSGVSMKKWASAVWKGNLKKGTGMISTETGVLKDAPYGFHARFEDGKGTNPEELIGAAHAACFSMALSMMLGEAGYTAKLIETHAEVVLDKVNQGFEITSIHLHVIADIARIDAKTFDDIANKTKSNCPVSKLLKAPISIDAKLELT